MNSRFSVALRFVAALCLSSPALASHIVAVNSVGMTVSDLDKAVDFYTRVLSFQKTGEQEVSGDAYEKLTGIFGVRVRVAWLKLGDESLVLSEYLTPRGNPVPTDARSNDRSFQHFAIIVPDMEKAYAWLRAHHVTLASPNPQRLPDWNKNAGGIQAFYFKDPDGHPLEVLAFPVGKGDPKWHRNYGDRLFLGIDHTAIVVASTEQSLHFYHDLLGFDVKGQSENYGIEQERLNNVYGAHLKITGLRLASGFGVEFLQYLTPAPCAPGQTPSVPSTYGDPAPCGRPYPVGARPNDLLFWQTVLQTRDALADAKALQSAGVPFLSSGTVTLSSASGNTRHAFLVRDPDGHAILIED